MKTSLVALVCWALVINAAVVPDNLNHLPDYVDTCSRDQPDVDSCILSAIQRFLPYLSDGVKEVNLPPLDPHYTEELLFNYANGHILGRAIIKDVYTRGIAGGRFLAVRSDFTDLDNFKLDIDVFFPSISSEGKHKTQGTFLTSEFGGRGDYRLNMTNITATWALTGSREVIDGVTFMRIKHFRMEPVVGDMKVYATNLFNGNESLTKSVVKLFNQYWRLVYAELLPYASKWWDRYMRDMANQVFMTIPFDEIFPVSN